MKLSDYEYLTLALEEAEQSFTEGTYPIGAIIVDVDGIVVSKGRNRVFSIATPPHMLRWMPFVGQENICWM